MERHDAFMTDAAFLHAVKGAASALALVQAHHNEDPDAGCELIAMCVLVAFANAGGLTEPHAGTLARFAPDLGISDGSVSDRPVRPL